LKIAIIGSRGFPSTYGGFETLVRYLAPYLETRGHEVEVYGRTEGSATLGRKPRSICGVTVRTTAGINSKSASTLTFGLTSALHAAVLSRPDVVIAVNVAMGHFIRILRWRRIPTILNVDGIEWERGKWGPLARRIFQAGARSAARDADVLIADAQEVARRWSVQFGRVPMFVPYGAEALSTIDESILEKHGLVKGRFVLVVARLVPENSIQLMLDALPMLRTEARIVIVGTSPRGDALREAVAEADRAGRVLWLGHLDDQPKLHALWRHCGVYVHGHTSGGTNPALLQAMANGCPVVALDTPFSREVLGDGYPLSPPVAKVLASAIDEVLVDRAHANRLAEMARARVDAHYAWDEVCSAYEALASKLAGG
jgi:glycosyltransferase involved in cell wall biosynthesis